MADPINRLRTFLEENTDKKGTPLYDRALLKLNELVEKSFEGSFETPLAEVKARELATREVVDFGTFAMATPAGRFIEGVADIPLGAAQFISESLGFDQVTNFLRDREQRISAGREAVSVAEGGELGEQGFDVPRLAGTIAAGTGAVKGVQAAATIPGRIAQGAGIGAVIGATTPAVSEDVSAEKAGQITAGAVTGGLFPAVTGAIGGAFRKGRDVLSSLVPGGAERSVRRVATEAVGGDVQPVVRELRAGGTTEQAIGRAQEPTLAALSRGAATRAPRETVQRVSQENTERIAAIRQSGGGSATEPLEATVQAARQTRQEVTEPLFTQASQSQVPVTLTGTQKVIDRMISQDPNNRKLIPALNEIKQTLAGDSAQEVISASRNIGIMISERGPNGIPVNEAIVRQLTRVKKVLDDEIGSANPRFREANELFSELSKPVNKAEIAQRLEQRLTSPLAGEEASVLQQRSAQFASALDDERKLIAQATGFKRGTGLDDIFSEEELVKLGNVSDRLSSDAEFARLATLGTPEANRLIQGLQPPKPIGMLDRAIVIIKGILTKVGTATEEATLKKAAEIFQDPNRLATLLESADSRSVSALKRVLNAIPFEDLARTAPAITAARQ